MLIVDILPSCTLLRVDARPPTRLANSGSKVLETLVVYEPGGNAIPSPPRTLRICRPLGAEQMVRKRREEGQTPENSRLRRKAVCPSPLFGNPTHGFIRRDINSGRSSAAQLSVVPQGHHRFDARSTACRQASRDRGYDSEKQRRSAIGQRVVHFNAIQQVADDRLRTAAQIAPTASPVKVSLAPSARIETSTSCRCAPSAMRTPISCVRLLTAKAMSPYSPIAANRSANEANAPSRTVYNRGRARALDTYCVIGWTVVTDCRDQHCGSRAEL